MNRIFLLCSCMLLFVVGCSDKQVIEPIENVIQDAQLTDREKNLLQAVAGDMLFAYDFSVNEQGGKLDVWIEKYEYGKLVDSGSGGFGAEMFEEKEGQIIVTLQEIPESNQAMVRMAVVDELGGYSSTYTQIELPEIASRGMNSLLFEQVALTDDLVIGQILYTEDHVYTTNGNKFYNDPSALANEVKDYPVAFFIRCSFQQETP